MATRRRVLAAVGLSVLGLAGCSDDPTSPETEDEGPGQAGGTPSPDRRTTDGDTDETPTDSPSTESVNGTADATTATETPGTETVETELDLREANVVDVAVTESDGAYRFDVTLVHDDDGEDGYADRWVVEDTAGTELGRRELAHPHGTREFTRSARIEVPEGVTCVVVRGHDQTHGYGGRVVLVNVAGGETAGVRQGSDRVPNAELADSCP